MSSVSNINATGNKELLNYNLPGQIANTLKCGYCMGYMSCGPIKIKNKKYVCGRCTRGEDFEAVAVPPLEVTMSNFNFPCRYDNQGCKKRLLFNSNLEHEVKCLYRTIPCPALNCETKLSVQTLYDHFQKSHEDCLMKDQFKIEIKKSSDRNIILKDRDSINIIKYQYNNQNKNLKLTVAAIIEEKKQLSKYKLDIINGKDVENRISLSQKSCHRHNSSIMEIGEFDIIDIESYFSILNYPEFIYIKITLFYSNEEVISESEINCQADYLDETNNEEEEQARQLLQKNVCTHCHRQNNYYSTITACVCQPRTNFKTINDVPCCWPGCNEIGDNKAMAQHIENCKFKMFMCPYQRISHQDVFRFNSSFLKHLKTHAEYCPDPNKIVLPLHKDNIRYDNEENYFTFLNKVIITIRVIIKSNRYWSILCTSSDEIKIDVCYTHNHCRLFIKEPLRGPAQQIEFTRQATNLSGCFLKLPHLIATLKIFK